MTNPIELKQQLKDRPLPKRPRRIRHEFSSVDQRVSAIVATRDFLRRISTHLEIKRVPKDVRLEAKALLRHFPPEEELRQVLEEALPKQERSEAHWSEHWSLEQ